MLNVWTVSVHFQNNAFVNFDFLQQLLNTVTSLGDVTQWQWFNRVAADNVTEPAVVYVSPVFEYRPL